MLLASPVVSEVRGCESFTVQRVTVHVKCTREGTRSMQGAPCSEGPAWRRKGGFGLRVDRAKSEHLRVTTSLVALTTEGCLHGAFHDKACGSGG